MQSISTVGSLRPCSTRKRNVNTLVHGVLRAKIVSRNHIEIVQLERLYEEERSRLLEQRKTINTIETSSDKYG